MVDSHDCLSEMEDLPGKVPRTARHGPSADRRGKDALMLHARLRQRMRTESPTTGDRAHSRGTEERKVTGVDSSSNEQRRSKRGEGVPRRY